MKQEQKQLWIVAALVIIIIIAVAVVQMKQKKTSTNSPESPAGNDQLASSTPTSTPEIKPAAPKTPSQKAADQALSYAQALKQYEGRRFQFDPKCQMVPSKQTFKSGTSVMFDNRSAKAITIRLGETPFTIKAYDYMLMKLTSKTLPNTISVDCNGSYNIGQILLQQ